MAARHGKDCFCPVCAERRNKWARIQDEMPWLAEFIVEWGSHSVKDKFNRPIKPEKIKKVDVIDWPLRKQKTRVY